MSSLTHLYLKLVMIDGSRQQMRFIGNDGVETSLDLDLEEA